MPRYRVSDGPSLNRFLAAIMCFLNVLRLHVSHNQRQKRLYKQYMEQLAGAYVSRCPEMGGSPDWRYRLAREERYWCPSECEHSCEDCGDSVRYSESCHSERCCASPCCSEVIFNGGQHFSGKMSPSMHACHRLPICYPGNFGIRALVVDNTPSGTLGVTGETVALQSTPGGHVRRAERVAETWPWSSLATSVEERVEALDVSDDDDEVDDAEARQILRWVQQGPVFLTPKPLSCSSTATENVGDASGKNSSLSQGTVIQPGSVADISVADAGVYPSTSVVGKTPRSRAIRNTHEGSDFDSDFDDEFDVSTIETAGLVGMGREIPDNDELDEPVRNIVASVESAMDEEAGRLPGVSDSYTWEENFESFRGVPEVFSGPTAGPLKDYDSPIDAFIDIWDKDIMERIALETNRYAQQTIAGLRLEEGLKPSSRLHRWTDTDADELMVLFAIYMFMGIDQRTSQNEYWESENVLEMPRFKNIMTYNRYVLLSKFLHFVDNSDASQDYLQCKGIELSPKLAKLAPVISHLNKKFASLYNLHREISIDESLTLFKGRLSWAQAIRLKAARFGIKSYELCESHTGYLYKFQIYAGKGASSDVVDVPPAIDLADKSTKVVLELLKGLENRGHSVTMDNFYNCPALARYLKSLGFDCLGTLRTNRKNVPNDIAKVPKNVSKGSIIARHSGDVSVVAWKDSKLVTMISTYHNADTYVGSKAGRSLVKPISVRDYNNTMGGVDLKDQKLSMYLLERKRCVKWYVKMFKRLLNVSIHNAFVMYVASLKRRDTPAVTHRDFRKKLANTLVERHRSGPTEICEPDGKIMRLRRDVMHVPQILTTKANRKRCVVHQRQSQTKLVHTKCVTCGVFLCFDAGDTIPSDSCWVQWHSLVELKGHEVRGRKRKRD